MARGPEPPSIPAIVGYDALEGGSNPRSEHPYSLRCGSDYLSESHSKRPSPAEGYPTPHPMGGTITVSASARFYEWHPDMPPMHEIAVVIYIRLPIDRKEINVHARGCVSS